MICTILNSNNYFLFPNPVNNNSTLRFNGEGFYSIRLLDLNGKEIKMLLKENLKSGLHELPINISSLQNGFYTIEISNGGNKLYKKMILVK